MTIPATQAPSDHDDLAALLLRRVAGHRDGLKQAMGRLETACPQTPLVPLYGLRVPWRQLAIAPGAKRKRRIRSGYCASSEATCDAIWVRRRAAERCVVRSRRVIADWRTAVHHAKSVAIRTGDAYDVFLSHASEDKAEVVVPGLRG